MLFASNMNYKNRRAVCRRYSGAAKIVAVEGGWLVFIDLSTYRTWLAQQQQTETKKMIKHILAILGNMLVLAAMLAGMYFGLVVVYVLLNH